MPSRELLRRLYWVAALAFLPTLLLQYVGEEAVTVIVAQEMRASGDVVIPTMYGISYGRPGLFAWLTLPIAELVGQGRILIAARIVTIAATVLTGLTLAWLISKIFKDELLAAFAAAIYLSGDTLIYRGWLAYADPLFAFLTFAAMACLWVATEERLHGLLLLGVLALIGSFLAKTVTGYVFYGLFGAVLAWRHPNRQYLFGPVPLLLHLCALAFPLVWDRLIAAHSVMGTVGQQLAFHFNYFETPDLLDYIRHVVWFPFRTIWYLLPASAIALYCLVRSRWMAVAELRQGPIGIAAWGLALNLLPYWLAPGGGTRYLMPIYPLIALVMAQVIMRAGEWFANLTVKALMATIAIAYVATLVGFPLHQHLVRGSYADAAREILARVDDRPIYASDTSSVGASIVANLNIMRAPQPPLRLPPPGWTSGFVLVDEPDPAMGQIAGRITVGGSLRYLLCRGPACG
jgi:4-amino-4-deoxy-L-arabinose transferase-like glycosyltransferase